MGQNGTLTNSRLQLIFTDRSPIELSGNVHKVSKLSELESLFSSNTYVIVDFYADWCPPCRAIAPTFSKLSEDYAWRGQLAFAKINYDHSKDVAKRYNITSMPTFLIFKDGEPTSVVVPGNKPTKSTGKTEEVLVEKIQGANIRLLKSVVQALVDKVQT